MSSNIHEEEVLGKSYDSYLMKRLLSYIKPYYKMVWVAVGLLLVLTAADLARPYLIKVAIDSHMQPLESIVFAPSVTSGNAQSQENQIIAGGYQFIRVPGNINSLTAAEQQNKWHMVRENGTVSMKPIQTQSTLSPVPLTDADVALVKKSDERSLILIGVSYLGIIILSFGLNFLQTMILQKTGQRVIYAIRQQLFSHIQRFSLAFFDRNPVGRLVTRIMNDTETLNEMYTNMLVAFLKDIFILVGIVIVMLQMNTELALVSFTAIPFIILSTVIYRKVARDAFREVRVKIARINATLSENISGMRIVQIFKREKQVFEEFDNINKDHYRSSMKELLTFAIFRPSMDLIYTMTLAVLIWYGGGQVLHNGLEFGVLYAFVSYIQQFFQPINDLSEKYNIMQSAMASSERIFQLTDTQSEIQDGKELASPSSLTGSVTFEHVWFAYKQEDWVLKDVNFTIHPGQTVAFVGATGAGKSSILNLITRFYDIQKGRILLGETDIKQLPLHVLRKQIAVVQQDVFLFTGTIRENIRLHEESITDQQVEDAIRFVNADSFIDKLPQGLDEPVQERGITFSSGQRQLLALARAIAFDPEILVLDEATANIDTETEHLIQDALKKITKNRTTIIVAHRLSTIQHADQIVVMHKGQVREVGTHQQLLEQRGMYYSLYQLQYKDESSQATSIV